MPTVASGGSASEDFINATHRLQHGASTPQKVVDLATSRIVARLHNRVCLRCRFKILKCHTNPADPLGDCLTCVAYRKKFRHSVLPCIRFNIANSSLSWPATNPPSDVLILAQTDHSLSQYLAESSADYVKTFMKSKDSITRGVFSLACGHGSPANSKLVQDSIRLWTVTRLSEGGHHSSHTAAQTHDVDIGLEGNVPMIDSITKSFSNSVIDQRMEKLAKQLRNELQDVCKRNRGQYWLTLFVVSYILLHNLEMIIKRERDLARRLRAELYYNNMPLIISCHDSAKVVLSYFHISCKGVDFLGLDWIPKIPRVDGWFSVRELSFVDFLVAELRTKRDRLVAVSFTHEYDEDFWLTGQLFDNSWEPRRTLITAPPQLVR